ncbi:hypothetical protein [Streptomyces rhizosphaericus]|uniref:Uncharacterized protein n=1 Tax=Streptomyces rhizosphaericus TaxID=114699 RepID=A0A6G4AT30_9ACTN|nr:hypothetical protein [Streptomyces rhizosphaericus]NEW76515.1 hypothetical protein [Streptomyces rhizosphaericus]
MTETNQHHFMGSVADLGVAVVVGQVGITWVWTKRCAWLTSSSQVWMWRGCPDRSRSLDDAHESDRGALAGDDVEAVGGVQERIGGDLLLDSDDPLHFRSPCSCGQVRRPPSTDSVVPVT